MTPLLLSEKEGTGVQGQLLRSSDRCTGEEKGTRDWGVGTKDGLPESGCGIKDGIQASGIGFPDKNGEGIDKKRLAYIVLLTVVAGFVVSFAIEWLQAYLPSRDSSLRDLITNILGTFVGAVIATLTLRASDR
jgi:hypothetical protein